MLILCLPEAFAKGLRVVKSATSARTLNLLSDVVLLVRLTRLLGHMSRTGVSPGRITAKTAWVWSQQTSCSISRA